MHGAKKQQSLCAVSSGWSQCSDICDERTHEDGSSRLAIDSGRSDYDSLVGWLVDLVQQPEVTHYIKTRLTSCLAVYEQLMAYSASCVYRSHSFGLETVID